MCKLFSGTSGKKYCTDFSNLDNDKFCFETVLKLLLVWYNITCLTCNKFPPHSLIHQWRLNKVITNVVSSVFSTNCVGEVSYREGNLLFKRFVFSNSWQPLEVGTPQPIPLWLFNSNAIYLILRTFFCKEIIKIASIIWGGYGINLSFCVNSAQGWV